MDVKVLYLKNSAPRSCNKIVAIKPTTHTFGSGETNAAVFGILTTTMTEAEINNYCNLGYCRVNVAGDGIEYGLSCGCVHPAITTFAT
jgi:hypothetical protein